MQPVVLSEGAARVEVWNPSGNHCNTYEQGWRVVGEYVQLMLDKIVVFWGNVQRRTIELNNLQSIVSERGDHHDLHAARHMGPPRIGNHWRVSLNDGSSLRFYHPSSDYHRSSREQADLNYYFDMVWQALRITDEELSAMSKTRNTFFCIFAKVLKDVCYNWAQQYASKLTDLASYTASERRAEIKKLSDYKLELVAESVLDRLSHHDDAVRRGAAVTLGAIADRLHRVACADEILLIHNLLKRDKCVVRNARESVSYWIDKLLHGIPIEVCQIIMRHAFAFSPTLAMGLVALTKSKDPVVRSSALHAFGQIGRAAGSYLHEVKPLLKDRRRDVRANAIHAVAKMCPFEVELHLKEVDDTDTYVASVAATYLKS